MSVITSIKSQVNKKRVNIFLDYKFAFSLDLQTFLKENLKVEQNLSEKEILLISKKGELQTIYDKILMFASLRPRSEKEYRDWFRKHKVDKSIHEELFNRLKRLELLDDKKFAIWWIEQRKQFRFKSKRQIFQELQIKGIAKEIINEALDENKLDERILAKELLQKKKFLWSKYSGFEKRKKMFNFLMQRGFKTEVIKDILGESEEI